MKKVIYTSCLLLIAEFAVGQNRAPLFEQYVQKYSDIAVEEMNKHGIPASITLAQACIESGNGTSRLAREANNHFGIKCHGWKGQTITQTDDAPNECFRKYARVDDSFTDHAEFLRYQGRYSSLFDLAPHDYKGWARGLKQAGYATNPLYAEMLIKVIEDEKLYEYDRITVVFPLSPKKLKEPVVFHPDERSPLYAASLYRTIYQQNQVSYIVTQPGDTYASLAREFRLFKRELLCFNEIKGKSKREALESGTVIYVAKKKKQAAKGLPMHIVEEGETLREISQRYGVRLSSLCKYNGLAGNARLIEDQVIVLRKGKK